MRLPKVLRGFPWSPEIPEKPVFDAMYRGKIHRVSIVRSGELSIVVRFGAEEIDAAKQLRSGALVVLAKPSDPLSSPPVDKGG